MFKYFAPRENSKRQKQLKENPRKEIVVACKCCHATQIQLIKAEDSYYCKYCFDKLKKKKYGKEV